MFDEDFLGDLFGFDDWDLSGRRKEMVGIGADRDYELRVEVEMLADRVARQALVIQALVATCIDNGVFTRQQLLLTRNHIDDQDGTRDGRAAQPSAVSCPSCGKANAKRRKSCMFCGLGLGSEDFEL
ncbi:MAG: hypothetical protein KDB07_09215 [Planctomycetes bacterium]|nr:hypothetical protein [Planctomycetota bacterium]